MGCGKIFYYIFFGKIGDFCGKIRTFAAQSNKLRFF